LYYNYYVPVSLSVRLPKNVAKDLDQVASATDRPRSYLVLKALESYLSEYADYQIALDRLRDQDDLIISSRELRRQLARKQRR
jgi:RHH-type rel operon transcriptional repressor/antitoxin RelB